MVAKLMGFVTPDVALQRFAEADRSVPARYARAIAWYRKGALGSALLGIDGLLKEYPNDPYFHEVRGQMLYENGRAAEAVLVLPPRRPASAELGDHQDRLCPRPARHQQSRQRPRGGAQPRARRAAGIRHASTCGA